MSKAVRATLFQTKKNRKNKKYTRPRNENPINPVFFSNAQGEDNGKFQMFGLMEILWQNTKSVEKVSNKEISFMDIEV